MLESWPKVSIEKDSHTHSWLQKREAEFERLNEHLDSATSKWLNTNDPETYQEIIENLDDIISTAIQLRAYYSHRIPVVFEIGDWDEIRERVIGRLP